MEKTIIFARGSLVDEDGYLYNGVEELLQDLNGNGDEIVVMSHDRSQIQGLLNYFEFLVPAYRHEIREHLVENSGECIIVGANDDDLKIAASRKTALFVPEWAEIIEELPLTYGLKVSDPNMLYQVIQIIKNQKHWFYNMEVDGNTSVYALTSANTKGNVTADEKTMVEGFRSLLKYGNGKYFGALEYHFLASLIHTEELKNVDIWGVMPSSSGTYNDDLFALKERARILMGKKQKENVLVRHTRIVKSHSIRDNNERLYCDRHLASIKLNPYFKKGNKLKGKTVCIIDDYLTNGTSFETARNLLLKAGVRKIIFISLGRFRRFSGVEYYRQDYELIGDIYSNTFSFDLLNEQNLRGVYNNNAKKDIENLYDILFN